MCKKIIVLLAVMTLLTGCKKNDSVEIAPEPETNESSEVSILSTLSPTDEPSSETIENGEIMNKGDLPILVEDEAAIQLPLPTEYMTEPTPAPTDEPTPAPTDEPTPAPTDEPTPAPTDEPASAPTDEPASAPTDEPTPGTDDDFEGEIGGLPIL